jgi:hypothetical protein
MIPSTTNSTRITPPSARRLMAHALKPQTEHPRSVTKLRVTLVVDIDRPGDCRPGLLGFCIRQTAFLSNSILKAPDISKLSNTFGA